ncbi:hypothetical protein NLJ89_g1188 [Agrocybe chaxingu]|uniref:G domain-containing protein n=1 Tax=Agrocybe chaxingu TaxID=84603 RepID=A0A9W8TET0_9AGAR|nr:hypothetical protein NLJ89_g1188 [Agrocybe chaxingu]
MATRPGKGPVRKAAIANDGTFREGRKTDIVILCRVMGTTGAGKSTFINTAVGEECMRVGHGLSVCTTKVQAVVVHPAPGNRVPEGHRLVLVDTPGFDTSYEDEEQTLQLVDAWFQVYYRKKTPTGGVIYLYNLSHDRFSGVARRSLERICRLRESAGLGKVVLSTANGGMLHQEERERRELNLRDNFWKSTIEAGAEVHHFQKEATSAWSIIETFFPLPVLGATSSLLSSGVTPSLSSDDQTTGPAREGERPQTPIVVNDAILADGRNTDIVIPVMGPTGAGKSTFINYALGKQRMTVGDDIDSCTTAVCPVVIDPIPGFPSLKGYRLVLVDTPGFDDTLVDDMKILRRIAAWLAASYRHKMTIGGVLYLQDISNKRFTGTARMNLEMFQRLCGDAALHKAVLATTNWGKSTSEYDQRHEEEMRVHHWSSLLQEGAEVRRFLGSSASAWDILNAFIQRADNSRRLNEKAQPLQIQEEVVDCQKHLEMAVEHKSKKPSSSESTIGPRKVVVIPVLGPTGAGKSTFINCVLEYLQSPNRRMNVGHSTTSCTTQPCEVDIDIKSKLQVPSLDGYRLVLLDTPGFDDTYKGDLEILKRIAKWLADAYRKEFVIASVLYFHDMSNKRFTASARKNLELFSNLCGDSAIGKTVLVTTNWNGDPKVLEGREDKLKHDHWAAMMSLGQRLNLRVQTEIVDGKKVAALGSVHIGPHEHFSGF